MTRPENVVPFRPETNEKPAKRTELGRPKLSEEEKEKRRKKRIAEKVNSGVVEIRDCIKIYFNPLQFAYLRDYHKQGGEQPGETIRQAVDSFFREKIASGIYTPSDDATPLAAKRAWEARLAKKKAEKEAGKVESTELSDGSENQEMSVNDPRVGEDI